MLSQVGCVVGAGGEGVDRADARGDGLAGGAEDEAVEVGDGAQDDLVGVARDCRVGY